MFAAGISFTYKGETSFPTTPGGVVSFFVIAISLIYGIQRLIIMVNRADTSKAINTIVKDLATDSLSIELSSTDFYFAINIDDSGNNLLSDSSYLDAQLEYSKIDETGALTSIPIFLTNWSDKFKFHDQYQLDKRNIISKFLCPENLDAIVQGNSNSDTFSFLELTIKKWEGQTYCETTSNIDDKINGLNFELIFINSEFDFDDYSSPVKAYLDSRIYSSIAKSFSKEVYISLQKRTYTLVDSIFSMLSQPQSDSFVGVDQIIYDFSENDSSETTVQK